MLFGLARFPGISFDKPQLQLTSPVHLHPTQPGQYLPTPSHPPVTAGTATDAPIARPLQCVTTVTVSASVAVAQGAVAKIEAVLVVVGAEQASTLAITCMCPASLAALTTACWRKPLANLARCVFKYRFKLVLTRHQVAKASVVYDPHTRDSRGFAFVTMDTVEEAEAAITGLHNTDLAGKPMTVEKARRGRARTPTPGKYLGTARRDDRGYGGGGYREDRYGAERPYYPREYDSRYAREDRRGGYDRDDRYGRGGYDDRRRYDDRRYEDRGRYEERGEGRGGRYEERGGGGGGGGGGGRYDRYEDRR
ncbi:hypothetical protein FRC12_010338 [Ceratobasidium sp. 428]|nr:hypothetical protein FRC12_010338 [Ceratobasidium sp. 428]